MNASDRRYAEMADKAEGRYHEVGVKYADRIVASEGARGRAWLKFNPGKKMIYAENPEGQMYGLTPIQVEVLGAIGTGYSGTMRELAARLEHAPSTISRAIVKLASFGFIAALTGKGRYGGTMILRRLRDDGLNRFRDAAKAKVRAWYQAAQRRVSRLEFNVAPYILERERGVDSLYYYLHSLDISIGATLTAQLSRRWTVEEIGDIR